MSQNNKMKLFVNIVIIKLLNRQILLKLQSDFVDDNTYEFDRNIVIFYT